MVIKLLNIFIIVFLTQIIVGCSFKEHPYVAKQELLYNYSGKDKSYNVSLKTILDFGNETGNDKYYILLDNDRLQLVPNNKTNNKIEYISFFKEKKTEYADSIFVHKIKNAPILNLENIKLKKSKNYKLDIRTTLWRGDDKENPYINFDLK